MKVCTYNEAPRDFFLMIMVILFPCIIILQSCSSSESQVTESARPEFVKYTLTKDFVSEGVAVGDVNRDGNMDILAGSFWFEAPEWKKHALDSPRVFPVIEGKLARIEDSYSNSMLNFAMDVNQDGWIDYIRIGFPGTAAYWYENPKGESGYWNKYLIHPAIGNESPRFVDVDGDGNLELLAGDSDQNQMMWLKPNASAIYEPWTKNVISTDSVPGTERFAHGLGYADVSGDGIPDVIIKEGWWEGPKDPSQKDWVFRQARLGQDCAQMEVYDIDKDGDKDVLSSSAHKRGIWWHEQIDQNNWKEHLITSDYSQTHVLAFKDLNGDGKAEIITGKRYLASRGNGDGAHEPAVLLWIEFEEGPDPKWTIHQIDDDSGVGLNIVVDDINGDGLPDIATANKKGVHYFEQRK